MKASQAKNLPDQSLADDSVYPPEDEISLIDIYRFLVKQKLTILGLTALSTLVAIVYAQSLPTIYEAKSLLVRPTEIQVVPIDVKKSPVVRNPQNRQIAQGVGFVQGLIIDLNADRRFKIFTQHLYTQTARRQVFQEMNLLKVFADKIDENTNAESVFNVFNGSFKVETVNLDKKGLIATATLSMQGTDPELISKITNRVVQIARENAISEIIEIITGKVTTYKQGYNQHIQWLLKLAAIKRNDRIEVLSEQAKIARSLGIIDPESGMANFIEIARSLGIIDPKSGGVGYLHLRGEKSLLAEISFLRNRKDEPLPASAIQGYYERLVQSLSVAPYISSVRERLGLVDLTSIGATFITVGSTRSAFAS